MLPQYQFISLLGRGGMGAVYKAVQLSLDRPVAVKVLADELIDDAEANFVERFKNEARTMARMNHPGIVNVYDFGEAPGGLLYIVMEFVNGTDVAQMVKSQGKLPPEYAHAITAHVSDALQYAHSQGIIHRDIKPANVLINQEGQIKVADFGLAKATDISGNTSGLTKTNMTMGTPDYVAPEALMIGMLADHRADLYAVGVMLYNMLTGEIPRGIFKMPSHKLGSDPRFDSIITKAMETDRDERYQSASEIRRDLDAILTTPKAKLTHQATPQGGARKPMANRPGATRQGSTDTPARSAPIPPHHGVSSDEAGKSVGAPVKKFSVGMIIGAVAALAVGAFFVFKKSAPPREESAPVATENSSPKPQPAAYLPANQPKRDAKVLPITSPPPSGIAKQTLDLLALTDPVQDRVPADNWTGKNEWVREGKVLVYKSDGKGGKIAAPIAFNCSDYEIEFRAERLSGEDRISIGVPVGNGLMLPLVFNDQGRKVIHEKEGKTWTSSGALVHVSIRVLLSRDGRSDRVIVQRKDTDETLADWTASTDTIGKAGNVYPAFPGQAVATISLPKDPYAIKTWTLRVFEGEAKVLRNIETNTVTAVETKPAMPPTSIVPATAPGIINLLALGDADLDKIEGDWKMINGELKGSGSDHSRIAFNAPVPEEYDFRIRFTRQEGNLVVMQHLPFQGREVLWVMGGAFNNAQGLFMINGRNLDDTNPTTMKKGLENGHRYESIVKVRRGRIQVELDGKSVVDYKTDGSDLTVVGGWKFPDPKKLGVGCSQPTVFHSIELIPLNTSSTPAMAAASSATDGWRNLFEGRTFSGWTAQAGSDPSKTWRLSDGEISSEDRTILLSPDSYTDYELELEWKMGVKGNGGVFYHVRGSDYLAALEMQLCDPTNSGGARSGGLFGIQNETRDLSKPLGEWNTARLVVRGTAREHWINGEKVCAYDVSSDQFRDLMTVSKFKGKVDPTVSSGKIALQANAGSVSYRNVRLRSLKETAPTLTTAPSPAMQPATQNTPAPTPAPGVPSITSSDPRLAQLETGFKARYEAEAQKPYLAALTTLNQSYIANGIGRARSAAQQKGALDEVTLLDSEKTRIQNGDPLPPADLDTLPKSLKDLRGTYRSALAKIETDRAQKASPLYDLYLGALDAYIAELTKGNKIDEAQKVKTLRDDIATQKPKTDAGTATTDSSARTGMNRPGTKPAPADAEDSTSGRGSRWYEAARWVVSIGGFLRVEKKGQLIDVRSEADIPPGRFEVLDIQLEANPKSIGIKDDDFTRLSGLKLRSISITSLTVTDAAFAFLPSTPDIEYIVMNQVPVTDAVLAHLTPLQKLTEFHIQSSPQFTGAGLEKLASLPVLKTVWFSGSGFSNAGAKAMAGAKNLEYFQLEGTPVTDEGIAGLGALTKLQTISLNRCQNVHGTTLAAWGNTASLRDLGLGACPLSADVLSVIGRFTHLTRLWLDDLAALNDETLSTLAPLTKLSSLSLIRTRITGTSFAELRGCTELQSLIINGETPITAEGLAVIASTFPKLEDLRLGGGARLSAGDFRSLAGLKALKYLEAPVPILNDADLAEIAKIASLGNLSIPDTAITAKGIAALKPLKLLTSLNVSNCKNIDDTAIPALKDLKWLKEIYINKAAITEEGAATLMKSLPGCKVIQQ
ncbi:hypothetical protein BH11VER1_BH11VER1_25920 [soil metagenome]